MCRYVGAVARAVVAFLDAVLVGCFLSWFGYRPRPDSPGSDGRRDPLVPNLRLGEVDLDYEKGYAPRRGSDDDFTDGYDIDDELRREANYLVLCGTISETPAELRNVSFQISLENTNPCDNMPTNALALEEISVTQVDSSSVSPFPTPCVLRDDMETPGTIYTSHKGSSLSRKRLRPRKQFVYPILRPIENQLQLIQQLTEYSSPMLPSNSSKRRHLGEGSIKKLQQDSTHSMAKVGLSYSASYQGKETPKSKSQIGSPNLLDGEEPSNSSSDDRNAALGLSLSCWLKPSSSDSENQGHVKCPGGGQLHDENSLSTECSVITASDMNWDVENPTPRLPKAWHGNGIPNTTTKYKEDQKVCWHTTPFEERLLRVLSEENPDPPRKLVRGRMFHFDGGES